MTALYAGKVRRLDRQYGPKAVKFNLDGADRQIRIIYAGFFARNVELSQKILTIPRPGTRLANRLG
jgi:hypothetical protein